MTIVIDARMIGWTGIGTYTRGLLDNLPALDTINTYLILLQDKDYETTSLAAPNFKKVRANYSPFSLSEQLGLAWLLYKLRPDLVHFLNFQGPCLYRRRRIFTIHDLTLLRFKNIRGRGLTRLTYELKYWVMRLVMRCNTLGATAIVTPSQFVKDDVISHWRGWFKVNPAKITVTHEGVDATPGVGPGADSVATSATPGVDASPVGGPYLLYVGNAYPHKNLERLAEAFGLLSRKFPDLRLVLVGGSDYFQKKLRQRVNMLGLANKVVFPGYVPGERLAAYYKHAEAYVFPSLSEGFGIPPLGAMQYGTPVISSNATCLPEILGDAAIYFDPTSTQDMADTIEALLNSPSELNRLRQAGPKQAAKYSWQRMTEQTVSVYQSVI